MDGGSSGILDKIGLIICGGQSFGRLKTCYFLDTVAKEWKWFGNMTTAREWHAIATFPNGSLWITGKHFFDNLDVSHLA